MSKVEIANPLPGGMRFTSSERAQLFCKRGMARMTIDGRLLFTMATRTSSTTETSEEDEFLRNRSGVLLWNGSPKPQIFAKAAGRHTGSVGVPMRRPGEVRS
jgi:hypothetical protein